MRSGMFTSVNGDRKYTSTFFAEYFASFIGNGVFPNPSTNTQVVADGGIDVTVQEGKAWIDGYILYVDNPQSLTLDTGDNLLPRIDKIVIRLDKINREIVLAVKKGTPATNPTAPNLQRDGDMHELGIANIRVNIGATNITQSNITDLRLNSNECGIVKGTIEEIDTTTLFNQYQSWISQKKQEFNQDLINYTNDKKGEWDNWYDLTTTQLQQEFMAWFNMLVDILDENTAGNLLNMITDIPKIFSGTTEPNEITIGDYWFREVY